MKTTELLLALTAGNGDGVTPASVALAISQMTDAQAAQALADLGYVKETIVQVSGTTPTITPEDNHEYNCGELASLTISTPPASGSYAIVFTSGATPTQTIIPPAPAMRWQTADNEPPQGFPAANVRYEINVKDTYVALGEWPVPGVST